MTAFYLSFVCQLADVKHALANVNNLLRTDLSNIVQKVSPIVCLFVGTH